MSYLMLKEKAYKYDVLDYQILNQQSEKIKREIRTVEDAVKLTVKQYISHEMISSIRQIIRTLTARYKSKKQKNEINIKITSSIE
jgi:hypothetical protein